MTDLLTQLARDGRRILTQRDVKIIVSVFAPPLGVLLHVGLKFHFWLNLVFTLLGYLPGLIHAVWLINVRKRGDNSKNVTTLRS